MCPLNDTFCLQAQPTASPTSAVFNVGVSWVSTVCPKYQPPARLTAHRKPSSSAAPKFCRHLRYNPSNMVLFCSCEEWHSNAVREYFPYMWRIQGVVFVMKNVPVVIVFVVWSRTPPCSLFVVSVLVSCYLMSSVRVCSLWGYSGELSELCLSSFL